MPATTAANGLIATALAKAQAEMRNPGFDRTNTAFSRGAAKPNYASLAAVRDATVPVLAKHGIAVLQDVIAVDGAVECTTRLMHGSGESLTFGPLRIPAAAGAQAIGSAATYARRFHLMAVCGVAGDEDDDGEAAEPVQAAPPPAIPTDAHDALEDAAKESSDALKAVWQGLKPATRRIITDHHAAWWNGLKDSAPKAVA